MIHPEALMTPATEALIRLGRTQGFLTYQQVNEYLPEDWLTAENLNRLLIALEEAQIELCSEQEALNKKRPDSQLRRFAPSPDNTWKSYPARILGPRRCSRDERVTLLVQSMCGGFVTANCCSCGKPHWLTEKEFRDLPLWVSCPSCQGLMSPDCVPSGRCHRAENYAYTCGACAIYLLLADILPDWHEVVRK